MHSTLFKIKFELLNTVHKLCVGSSGMYFTNKNFILIEYQEDIIGHITDGRMTVKNANYKSTCDSVGLFEAYNLLL